MDDEQQEGVAVDVATLRHLATATEAVADDLEGARSSVAASAAGGLGDGALDAALGEFHAAWGGAAAKAASSAGAVADALRAAADRYEQAEQHNSARLGGN